MHQDCNLVHIRFQTVWHIFALSLVHVLRLKYEIQDVNLVMQQPSVRAGVPDLGTSPRWEGEET